MEPALVGLLVQPAFHTQVRIVLLVVSESAQLEVRVRGDSLSGNCPTSACVRQIGVRQRMAVQGGEAVPGTPEQLGATMRADLEKWTRVIRVGNIRPD